MASLSLDIFNRLVGQTHELEAVASRDDVDGTLGIAPILRRSGFLLAVAALDSYFHERAIDLLSKCAERSPEDASRVGRYVGVSRANVESNHGISHIRLRLTFKTLVAPNNIDKLLEALGYNPEAVWLSVAFELNSRPDRLRRLLELVYDRRNQIAHEADWDVGLIDFRPMERAHLRDCLQTVTDLVEKFDKYFEDNS